MTLIPTMDDAAGHYICSLAELDSAPLERAGRIVSILEPAAAQPPVLRAYPGPLLTLRFDDVIEASDAFVAPVRADIEQLLAFDGDHASGDALLVHCTAGISRSTAALAILLAARSPGDEAGAFAQVRSARPKAWPNSLMIALADDVLGSSGRLRAELREHYKLQLRRFPEIGRMVIGLGREREVPFDRLRP